MERPGTTGGRWSGAGSLPTAELTAAFLFLDTDVTDGTVHGYSSLHGLSVPSVVPMESKPHAGAVTCGGLLGGALGSELHT